MHVCIGVYIYTHTHVCTHISVCMHIYIYIYVYTSIYIYREREIHIYIYRERERHIYIYICSPENAPEDEQGPQRRQLEAKPVRPRDIPDKKFENQLSKPLTTKEISLFVKK